MTGRTRPDTKNPSAASRKGKPAFSLISRDKLVAIYAAMVRCQMLDEQLRALPAASRSAGRDRSISCSVASLAGAAIDLRSGDAVASSDFAVFVELIRGVALGKVLRARRQAPALAEVSPASVVEKIVRQAGIATVDKRGDVAMLFSSGRPTSIPGLESALKSAADCELPFIAVLLHPGGAPGPTPKSHTRHRTRIHGVPRFVVDADDAVAVYRVAYEAIARARLGRGPSLIECISWRPHSERGVRQIATVDAIGNMERYLAGKGFFSAAMRQKIKTQFQKELRAAATKLLKYQSNGRMVK